jgi:hypothetical protein
MHARRPVGTGNTSSVKVPRSTHRFVPPAPCWSQPTPSGPALPDNGGARRGDDHFAEKKRKFGEAGEPNVRPQALSSIDQHNGAPPGFPCRTNGDQKRTQSRLQAAIEHLPTFHTERTSSPRSSDNQVRPCGCGGDSPWSEKESPHQPSRSFRRTGSNVSAAARPHRNRPREPRIARRVVAPRVFSTLRVQARMARNKQIDQGVCPIFPFLHFLPADSSHERVRRARFARSG